MKGPFPYLAISILLAQPATGFDDPSDLVLQHEIRVSEGSSRKIPDSPVLIVVDLKTHKVGNVVSRKMIQIAARQKFTDHDIETRIFQSDYIQDLSERRISLKDLLAPKIIVGIEVSHDDSGTGFWVACRLAFITYQQSEKSGDFIVAKRVWSDRRDIQGITGQEIEDNLATHVQSALGNFLRSQKGSFFSHKVVPSRGSGVTKVTNEIPNGSESPSYKLRWTDPDNRRNHFFVGGSVGTPALANLNLGFWGGRSVPMVIGLSGMYFGDERRGIQLDAGWAFINEGKFRQVIGASLLGINETTRNTTVETNVFGQPTRTNIETINQLRPYVGPTYTLDWKSFRAQTGVGFKLDPGAASNVRFLFQLGYTPPLDL